LSHLLLRAPPAFVLTALLSACAQEPRRAPTDGDEVRERAIEAQTARRRTGAEIQDRALNRVIRTVYLCEDSERLTVDFDNPRQMATVRTSNGEAVDLYQERAASGIWYRASGHDLRGKGDQAVWTVVDRDPANCRAVD
jgi:membrane-bound inhibitor of C-type lysozyme